MSNLSLNHLRWLFYKNWADINPNATGGFYTTEIEDGDLTSGLVTITHSLNEQYPKVAVYDENNNEVGVGVKSINSLSTQLDFTGFGTLGGTFNASFIGPASTGTYRSTFVDGDLIAGAIALTHNLQNRYNAVTVWDGSGNEVGCKVTATSSTVVTLDFAGFGTLTGTFTCKVMK